MNRFFVNPEQIVGTRVVITDGDAHHIINVLRLKLGSRIALSDGDNYEYEGIIDQLKKDSVVIKIDSMRRSQAEPPVDIILAQGITKKMDKFELVVQKATELGAVRIVPLVTERTVVELAVEKGEKRRDRWQRIALEAAKQSQRARIPKVDTPTDMDSFLKSIPRDILCIIPWEGERAMGIKEVLNLEREKRDIREAVLIIGPEGGFSQEEVERARKAGAVPASLGPRILRSETAGIVALGILMYELGDLGG
ncbi:MAG: 16S rRNA (uracil(1498)-N(3))-methyltransferase [Clostridia bacterium]|nr:16S rRNA (uracil(1498)-N(3))-methyltransferase [Clostridia bacterium]